MIETERRNTKMLKKIFGFILAAILIIIALSSIGPMIGLAVSLGVLYFAYKQYRKSTSFWGKVLWGAIGIIAVFSAIGNMPALIGALAIYFVYVMYKNWKKSEQEVVVESNDPFTNFENEWNRLNKF